MAPKGPGVTTKAANHEDLAGTSAAHILVVARLNERAPGFGSWGPQLGSSPSGFGLDAAAQLLGGLGVGGTPRLNGLGGPGVFDGFGTCSAGASAGQAC